MGTVCFESDAHVSSLYFLTSPAVAYNSTDATSIANNVAYITADLNFVTWTFHLLDQFQIDLCNQNLVASENNAGECPGDGSYSFSMDYALPNSKDASTWVASGWGGSGTILSMVKLQRRKVELPQPCCQTRWWQLYAG